MNLKKNDCLQTPEWVFSELGAIDLDPCAGINTRIGVENWSIERGECGLERDWFGFVYCNPPFSQKEQWAEKMIQHGSGILIQRRTGSMDCPNCGEPIDMEQAAKAIRDKGWHNLSLNADHQLARAVIDQRLIDDPIPIRS